MRSIDISICLSIALVTGIILDFLYVPLPMTGTGIIGAVLVFMLIFFVRNGKKVVKGWYDEEK